MREKPRRKRDLTESQFLARCAKRGLKGDPYSDFGYFDIGHGVRVSRFNGGERRRDQLRFLLRAQKEIIEKIASEWARATALRKGAPR